jgi:hypothetical protein
MAAQLAFQTAIQNSEMNSQPSAPGMPDDKSNPITLFVQKFAA